MTRATDNPDPLDAPKPTFSQRVSRWLTRVQFVLYTVLALCLFATSFLWSRMFLVVPPGHRGVMYRTIYGGTVTSESWPEGLHILPPWDKMYVYDLRLQRRVIDFEVLSDEGLTLGVQVVVRFRPQEEMLGFLQKDVGPSYFESLIQPEIESHIRRTFGGRPAHEVYASMRNLLQEVGQFPLIGRVEQSNTGTISRPYIYVQELKLTKISLPKIVEESILEKYREEQRMLAYRYKLEREQKEAERKRTEATGIRDFNMIARTDILRWRSIDAALELAKSNNSKVIVLGGSPNAMQMQLQVGDGPAGGKLPGLPELPASPDEVQSPAPVGKPPTKPKQPGTGRAEATTSGSPSQEMAGSVPSAAETDSAPEPKGLAASLFDSVVPFLRKNAWDRTKRLDLKKSLDLADRRQQDRRQDELALAESQEESQRSDTKKGIDLAQRSEEARRRDMKKNVDLAQQQTESKRQNTKKALDLAQ